MAKIEEKVENLVKGKVEELGYILYDVIYLKESKNYTLRIVIDNNKGIKIEDCEKVNNEIMPLLDEANYIKDQYNLEISSPGIERVLRKEWQLKENIGKEVKASLFQKDEKGNKEYTGTLEEITEESIKIEGEKIKRNSIAQIKTVYRWE